MTAKEKVLKVYPDAKVAGNANVRIVSLSAMEILSRWYASNEEEAAWQNAAESLPVEAKEEPIIAAKIACYEVYDAKDIDCTVFQHERMNDLQDFVYQLLDGLEDGESIRIEFRNYMQEELDEVYDEL